MRKKRRGIRILLGGLVCLTLLSGCGIADSPSSDIENRSALASSVASAPTASSQLVQSSSYTPSVSSIPATSEISTPSASSTPATSEISTPSISSTPAMSSAPPTDTMQDESSSYSVPDQGVSEGKSSNMLSIEFEGHKFTATLTDSPSAAALKAMLPMTIEMGDLNSNEKYYNMSSSLPTNLQPRGDIKNGDIMLYGSDCLVLFYESFSSSYSYTRLGTVEDPSGLAEALGSGSVIVTWSLA